MWTSWSRVHATHNKIYKESWKAITCLIGVWHNGNLSQDINSIGIRTPAL
jgi:hypothetical protein